MALELEDYAALPVTADNTNDNTRAQLARVNYLRDEPGGRRFFVNDLNGPLYILDKQTKTFTTYLNFNGAGGRPGLFPKFTFERNFATGLTNFIFDPAYAENGTFYTLHMEDPSVAAPAVPKAGVVAGLDLTGYTTTPAVQTPTVNGQVDREVVLVEWRDRNVSNSTFEGTAREVLRVQYPLAPHPLGEMTFNPVARPGDPEWRVMSLGAGDAQSGEQRDSRRLNPQRLDTLVGKILRIIPDLREHTNASAVSENGRYRIPNDNPFVEFGRRPEGNLGVRPAQSSSSELGRRSLRGRGATLLAFNIGLVSWETILVIRKGANYGYPLREGTQVMSENGMSAVPQDDRIPVQVSDTVVRGTVTPTYPVAQFPHTPTGGDAIANGFVYRGKAIPALRNKLLFSDITTGRFWYAEIAEVLAADDNDPTTVAPIHEVDSNLRQLVEESYRSRGGKTPALPGFARVSGPGRVDVRLASDEEGELYVLTKADGMIRKVVGAPVSARSAVAAAPSATPPASSGPVPSSPQSIAAGKKIYDTYCAACHGNVAQGAVRAGIAISIIQEQNRRQPPDLTDTQWDHGSTDADIVAVIKRGVPTTMMPPFDGNIADADVWNIVNYLRSLSPQR